MIAHLVVAILLLAIFAVPAAIGIWGLWKVWKIGSDWDHVADWRKGPRQIEREDR